MNKELRAKTNEELCALIVRLKLQLLESRFRMASGELEKLHTLPEIRKTIARALTVLNERSITLTIGTHGVTMYDNKTKTAKSITNLIDKSINSLEETAKSSKKDSTITKKQGIKTATTAAVKAMPNSSSASAKTKSTGPVKKGVAAKASTGKVGTRKVTKTIRKKVQAA